MEHPLKAFRARKGLTIEDMAALADTSRATISRIENGLQEPSFGLVRRIVKATGGEVTADALLAAAPALSDNGAAA